MWPCRLTKNSVRWELGLVNTKKNDKLQFIRARYENVKRCFWIDSLLPGGLHQGSGYLGLVLCSGGGSRQDHGRPSQGYPAPVLWCQRCFYSIVFFQEMGETCNLLWIEMTAHVFFFITLSWPLSRECNLGMEQWKCDGGACGWQRIYYTWHRICCGVSHEFFGKWVELRLKFWLDSIVFKQINGDKNLCIPTLIHDSKQSQCISQRILH